MMMTEFITLGFGDLKELIPLLFLLFGIVYIATVLGNLLLRGSNILPRMLVDLLRENRVIFTVGCIIQLYFFGNQVSALNKSFSLFYIVVSPLCNLLIYSLKNEDFKEALKKLRI
ncbi:PREDICTED: olfactory receptor 5AP2-like [Galeopterus variegatus]|uniref:Olfactory receptor 5AP2-like n=1 Tax=Galeopterus variegatus TaxID=482537 RepID=A0ABM0QW19_GALVR|nr:PREDICTED: olfactory receptor 5AP2-like [Galeopterus variegatus]